MSKSRHLRAPAGAFAASRGELWAELCALCGGIRHETQPLVLTAEFAREELRRFGPRLSPVAEAVRCAMWNWHHPLARSNDPLGYRSATR